MACVYVHTYVYMYTKKVYLFCVLNYTYRFLMKSIFWWKWMICDWRIVGSDPSCVTPTALVFSLCSGVWRMVYTSAPLLVCIHSFLICLLGNEIYHEIYEINEIYQVALPGSFVPPRPPHPVQSLVVWGHKTSINKDLDSSFYIFKCYKLSLCCCAMLSRSVVSTLQACGL